MVLADVISGMWRESRCTPRFHRKYMLHTLISRCYLICINSTEAIISYGYRVRVNTDVSQN